MFCKIVFLFVVDSFLLCVDGHGRQIGERPARCFLGIEFQDGIATSLDRILDHLVSIGIRRKIEVLAGCQSVTDFDYAITNILWHLWLWQIFFLSFLAVLLVVDYARCQIGVIDVVLWLWFLIHGL
jgi:hypothetical protein